MQLRHAPSTNWDLEFYLHLTNSYWLPLNHYKLKRQCCRQDKSLWINRQLLWEDHVGAHADKLEHIITKFSKSLIWSLKIDFRKSRALGDHVLY